MPAFSITVHGKFPSVNAERGVCPRGFYAARIIKAASDADAQRIALQSVAADPKTAVLAAHFGSLPELTIDSVGSAPWWHRFRRQPGYVVYDESLEA